MLEGADAEGQHDDVVLRGDTRVVRQRRERAGRQFRVQAVVQAELDTIRPLEAQAPVAAEMLRKEREAVAERGNIARKTAAKVSTDEHTWELFVAEQGIEVEHEHPCIDTVIEFAVWMTRHRERACLPRLVALL